MMSSGFDVPLGSKAESGGIDGMAYKKEKNKMKSAINYFRLGLAGMVFPLISFADEAAHAAGAVNPASSWMAIAVGFGIALAVIAASTAQGRIASAFMEGASRNPGAADVMKTPLILSLIFVETLVLLAFVIVIMLQGKI